MKHSLAHRCKAAAEPSCCWAQLLWPSFSSPVASSSSALCSLLSSAASPTQRVIKLESSNLWLLSACLPVTGQKWATEGKKHAYFPMRMDDKETQEPGGDWRIFPHFSILANCTIHSCTSNNAIAESEEGIKYTEIKSNLQWTQSNKVCRSPLMSGRWLPEGKSVCLESAEENVAA